MNESKNEPLIRYRLKRAREALADARLLAAAESWNSCVNRLYYACFYAVSALFLRRGLSSAKHSGIRSLFNRHLVKTGEVSAEMGRLYNDLFRDRQESDYTDLVEFQADQVQPRIPSSARFVEHLVVLSGVDPDTDGSESGR